MGNNSNKKKKRQENPVVSADVASGIATSTLALVGNNVGKVHRLVARHQLKDRVQILESIIRTHQPLVNAMKVTQKAYQDGVMEGIRQVAAAEREKEEKQAREAEAQAGPTLESVPTTEGGRVEVRPLAKSDIPAVSLSHAEPCQEHGEAASNQA